MEEIASDPTFLPILEGFGNEVLIALPLLGLFIFSYFYFFVFNQLALPVVDGADPAVDAQNLTPDQLREQFLAGWGQNLVLCTVGVANRGDDDDDDDGDVFRFVD